MKSKKNKKNKIKMKIINMTEIKYREIEKVEDILKDKTLKNWSRVVLGEYLYSLKHDK